MARKLKSDTPTAETAEPPKKRGRKPSAAPAASSNVTEDTRREFYTKALNARNDLDKAREATSAANGVYRAILKEAKKVGIDPYAIVWVLNARTREIDELNAEIRQINWMAKAAGLPIGGQLGLFEDGVTVATKVDDEKAPAGPASEEQRSIAYNMGFNALDKDTKSTLQDNDFQDGTEEHAEWQRGWLQRQSNLADELAADASKRMPKAKGNGQHATA